jgi:hypothetical protein
MNWKKYGFSQKKPKRPGVYFIVTDRSTLNPPQRLREGWDVCEVVFYAGSYTNMSDNVEEFAHWRIHTLGGISHAWGKGTWMKGPINALEEK